VFGLPIAPAVIGVILGPMTEIQLRRALAIGAGDVTVLVKSPIAAVLLALVALVALLAPLVRRRYRLIPSKNRQSGSAASDAASRT
jgi:putative tricarboxylic transport membrane protein